MQEPVMPASDLLDLVLSASPETTVVLVICAICSVVSWYVIGAKWWEFRRLARQRAAFDAGMARSRAVDVREQVAAEVGFEGDGFFEQGERGGGFAALTQDFAEVVVRLAVGGRVCFV